MSFFSWKALFALVGAVVYVAAYVPYLKSIFSGKTKPHLYTWFIWLLTTGTAALASFYGGGGFSADNQILNTVLIFFFFLLAFRYGTKNITTSDVVILLFALVAFVSWWQLHSPVLAVFIVTAIDGIAYVPTVRKLLGEPESESMTAWAMFLSYSILAFLAIHEYNLLTVPYILMTIIANATVLGVCLKNRVISRA